MWHHNAGGNMAQADGDTSGKFGGPGYHTGMHIPGAHLQQPPKGTAIDRRIQRGATAGHFAHGVTPGAGHGSTALGHLVPRVAGT